MVKIIFLDIDGTLINPEIGTITPAVKNILKKVLMKGIILVLVSGRSPFTIIPLAKELSIDSYIANNGAIAVAKGHLIFDKTIPSSILEPLCQFSSSNHDILLLSGLNHYHAVFETNPLLNIFLKHLKAGPIIYKPDAWKYEKVYQVELLTTQTKFGKYQEDFKGHLHFFPWQSMSNLYHVNQIDTSKHRAMIKVLNAFSLTSSVAAAIGDGMNDLEMVKACKVGIAMGNACQDLKDVAKFTTGDVAHDGIIPALEQLIR